MSCRPACRAQSSHARRASRAGAGPFVARLAAPDWEKDSGRSRFIVRLRFEITPDLRCSQNLLDAFCFVESFVDAKTNLRCKFQVNAMRDLTAQKFLVALKRRDDLLQI